MVASALAKPTICNNRPGCERPDPSTVSKKPLRESCSAICGRVCLWHLLIRLAGLRTRAGVYY